MNKWNNVYSFANNFYKTAVKPPPAVAKVLSTVLSDVMKAESKPVAMALGRQMTGALKFFAKGEGKVLGELTEAEIKLVCSKVLQRTNLSAFLKNLGQGEASTITKTLGQAAKGEASLAGKEFKTLFNQHNLIERNPVTGKFALKSAESITDPALRAQLIEHGLINPSTGSWTRNALSPAAAEISRMRSIARNESLINFFANHQNKFYAAGGLTIAAVPLIGAYTIYRIISGIGSSSNVPQEHQENVNELTKKVQSFSEKKYDPDTLKETSNSLCSKLDQFIASAEKKENKPQILIEFTQDAKFISENVKKIESIISGIKENPPREGSIDIFQKTQQIQQIYTPLSSRIKKAVKTLATIKNRRMFALLKSVHSQLNTLIEQVNAIDQSVKVYTSKPQEESDFTGFDANKLNDFVIAKSKYYDVIKLAALYQYKAQNPQFVKTAAWPAIAWAIANVVMIVAPLVTGVVDDISSAGKEFNFDANIKETQNLIKEYGDFGIVEFQGSKVNADEFFKNLSDSLGKSLASYNEMMSAQTSNADVEKKWEALQKWIKETNLAIGDEKGLIYAKALMHEARGWSGKAWDVFDWIGFGWKPAGKKLENLINTLKDNFSIMVAKATKACDQIEQQAKQYMQEHPNADKEPTPEKLPESNQPKQPEQPKTPAISQTDAVAIQDVFEDIGAA